MNSLDDMSKKMRCPCGGGQSCIVDRRWLGDWIYEDEIFKKLKIKLIKNYFQKYSKKQREILKKEIRGMDI